MNACRATCISSDMACGCVGMRSNAFLQPVQKRGNEVLLGSCLVHCSFARFGGRYLCLCVFLSRLFRYQSTSYSLLYFQTESIDDPIATCARCFYAISPIASIFRFSEVFIYLLDSFLLHNFFFKLEPIYPSLTSFVDKIG